MIITSELDIQKYTEAGWWGRDTLFDVFRAVVAAHPDAVAVVDPPNRAEFTDGPPARLTWAQVSELVDRLSCALLDAGLRSDDIVVAQLPTTHEFLLLYLACWRLGIIVSPVPMQYREHELSYITRHLSARAYIGMSRHGKFSHADLAASVVDEHPTISKVLLFGDQVPQGMITLGAWMSRPADHARLAEYESHNPVDANALATIIWTSGTESRPKAVPRSHNQWLVSRRLMTDAADLRIGCHILSPRLLSTMGGISGSIVTWLDRAARLVLHQPMSLPIFLQQIQQEGIEFTSVPPAILQSMLADETLLQGIDFSRLRYVSSGSAALPPDTVRAFHERFGVNILNFYGSSEGASLAAAAADLPDPGERSHYFPRFGSPHCRSSQTLAKYVETRLVDLVTGEPIEAAGVTGELCFRGPGVFSAYFGAPDVTARTFTADGFYRTGDLFRIAGPQAEFLEFVGRAKNIIVRGGMNISAEELESLIVSHPRVREVAVIGYPDEKLGEKVCAVIVRADPDSADPLTLQALCDYLRLDRQVSVFKLPQHMVTLAKLPVNPAGKVLKAELQRLVLQSTQAAA